MNKIKSFIIIILLMVLIAPVSYAAAAKKAKKPSSPITHRVYDVETKDGFVIKAYLSYPKTQMDSYPVVILLHSLGYNYTYFNSFADKLNYAGFAVVGMDLRGHGKSIYTKTLKQRSWQYFKYDTYALYPTDVLTVLQYVKTKNKKMDFSNYAIVGGDVGANTAVLVAKALPKKPKAMVLFSPMMTFKGLYIPVAMTEIGLTPILALASEKDSHSMAEQKKLAKFAQGTFDTLNTPKGGTGLNIMKSYPELEYQLTLWLKGFFKGQLTAITPQSIAAGKAKLAAKKKAKLAKQAALKAAKAAKAKMKQ